MTLVLVFAAARLASAWLMFSAEPLLAKMLLPLLGGAPAVWNASLVFFQGAVLAGYAAAHGLSRLGTKRHALLHVGILALAWLALPIQIHGSLLAGAHPSVRVIVLLAAAAGIPFFALAMNGPAVARVFGGIDHPATRDPYLLYAASNAGSLFALLAYPFLIEMRSGLATQSRLFGYGFLGLVALAASCAVVALRMPARAPPPREQSEPTPWKRRLRWLALATVPSAQLVGLTQFLTTDVAPAPLLWIVPLALYLLSFVLVFARRLRPPHTAMVRLLPLFAAMAALTLETEVNSPPAVIVGVHLTAFVFAAMVCHGELADDRPPPSRLTEYYLWMSGGGVLGGLAAALVAPALLDRNAEYPITIVLALLLRPGPRPETRREWLTVAGYAAAIGVLAVVVISLAARAHASGRVLAVMLALPVLIMYRSLARPVQFALALAATFLASATYQAGGPALLHERNFFGALRVQVDTSGRFTQLVHGTTVHGRQTLDPAHRREATSYYHSTGPAGDLLRARKSDAREIGVIGLGAGSLAAYARPTERWTFFEINPAVVAIATAPRYFTFLSDAFPDGDRLRLVVGDARLRLRDVPERFDVLVVDAFSSDAIPMHLLTLEALDLYFAHLTGDGLLAFHCSNRHLDLEPVLGALAIERTLAAAIRFDEDVPPELEDVGKNPSTWAVMARTPATVGALSKQWRPIRGRADVPVWTDDASSIVPILFH